MSSPFEQTPYGRGTVADSAFGGPDASDVDEADAPVLANEAEQEGGVGTLISADEAEAHLRTIQWQGVVDDRVMLADRNTAVRHLVEGMNDLQMCDIAYYPPNANGVRDHAFYDGKLSPRDIQAAAHNIFNRCQNLHTSGTNARGSSDPTLIWAYQHERLYTFVERINVIADLLRSIKMFVVYAVYSWKNIESLFLLAPTYAANDWIEHRTLTQGITQATTQAFDQAANPPPASVSALASAPAPGPVPIVPETPARGRGRARTRGRGHSRSSSRPTPRRTGERTVGKHNQKLGPEGPGPHVRAFMARARATFESGRTSRTRAQTSEVQQDEEMADDEEEEEEEEEFEASASHAQRTPASINPVLAQQTPRAQYQSGRQPYHHGLPMPDSGLMNGQPSESLRSMPQNPPTGYLQHASYNLGESASQFPAPAVSARTMGTFDEFFDQTNDYYYSSMGHSARPYHDHQAHQQQGRPRLQQGQQVFTPLHTHGNTFSTYGFTNGPVPAQDVMNQQFAFGQDVAAAQNRPLHHAGLAQPPAAPTLGRLATPSTFSNHTRITDNRVEDLEYGPFAAARMQQQQEGVEDYEDENEHENEDEDVNEDEHESEDEDENEDAEDTDEDR